MGITKLYDGAALLGRVGEATVQASQTVLVFTVVGEYRCVGVVCYAWQMGKNYINDTR